jgi:NAD-dependent dihydropyrimidine dehydrogenase PreA subunit
VKIMRKIIGIDESRCAGCGECEAACAEGAIRIVDGKARLVFENYCDGLGACLGECPEGALTIMERESDEFDRAGVEERLKSRDAGGGSRSAGKEAAKPVSALTHWPVQIKLIPPDAPFLLNADLLIAADCTPLAYAGFHQNLLPGKVVMMGCPKFDDVTEYVERFAEIFKVAEIRSITVVDMEVPCCSKLPMIVGAALTLSRQRTSVEEIVIGRKGKVLRTTRGGVKD